jgi:hypothetical protein
LNDIHENAVVIRGLNFLFSTDEVGIDVRKWPDRLLAGV